MNELAYLLAVVVLSSIGFTILWFRHRKPTTLDSSVTEFSRGLNALSPEYKIGRSGPIRHKAKRG